MPRNGSGLYVPPPANYPAVSATTITAANRNAIDADLATALTNSIAVNGESVVTADIPFGNNKLTGVKDGTLAKDAANVSQIQNSNAILLASVAGTDTITASLSPALTAYANGQIFTLIPANTNTGAVTININGLGAKSITKNGSTALVAGDLVAGVTYSLQYDGTRFQRIAGSDYAKSDNYAKSGANSDITSLTALSAGSAAAPSVSFSADKNTGAFNTAPDEFGIAVAGAQVANFTSSGLEITGKITGVKFQTLTTSTSTTTGVATTLHTFSNTSPAMWLASAYLGTTGNASAYGAFAMIFTDGTSARLFNNNNGSLQTLTMSGLALQGTQTSGTTQTINLTLTKIG